jgi:hypothetical protein
MSKWAIRLVAIVLCWLVLKSSSIAEEASQSLRLDPARTHAVIVGVLHWQDRSLTAYSSSNRKDQELYDTLVEIGIKKKNVTLLLDEQATLANIREAIHEVAQGATKGDTFIFYYAGHGVSAAKGTCLLNYDAGKADSFAVSELATILKKVFRGERVLMFADCCFSGGLMQAAKDLADHGLQSASLTSAAATNASTNNWTFTHTLIDTFRGSPAADRDGDHVVTLEEAATEVADAMKFREYQRHGHSRFGVSNDFQLCKAAKNNSVEKIPPPFRLFEYVQVQENNRWIPARIVDYRKEEYVAEIQQYSTRRVLGVSKRQIRKFPNVEFGRQPVVYAKPTKVLGARESLAKAEVGGKYGMLLKKIKVEDDYRQYSEFNDYGYYRATDYVGYSNLPAGY